VDQIEELIPGRTIQAVKSVRGDEDFFADHFPGFPVLPGVLLTEMMAQTAGKCLDAEGHPRGKAMLVQISKASFREWVKPPRTLCILAEIRTSRSSYATALCSVKDGEKQVCSAELLFAFLPLDKLAKDYKDEVLESFLAQAQGSRELGNHE
jgi:3-hydroxyacyl-[acyl-carrier-protein] dehydratase